MTTTNDPTFELCPHDKENPYKQISRALIQDRSISPKAKGVLIYLLSLPRDWKIHHSQLQYGLNIGEDYLNSALDELIKAGYADRTRERIKGVFQPYRYKIREFKKCLPDGENRPGSTGPGNPVIQKTETSSTEETATERLKPAAAFSSSTSKKEKSKEGAIYACLHDLSLTKDEMIQITRSNTKERIVEAVRLVKSKKKPPRNLAAFITWAAADEIMAPMSEEENFEENKKFAIRTEKEVICPKGIDFVVLSKHAEIVFTNCPKQPICLDYRKACFKGELQRELKTNKFRMKNDSNI